MVHSCWALRVNWIRRYGASGSPPNPTRAPQAEATRRPSHRQNHNALRRLNEGEDKTQFYFRLPLPMDSTSTHLQLKRKIRFYCTATLSSLVLSLDRSEFMAQKPIYNEVQTNGDEHGTRGASGSVNALSTKHHHLNHTIQLAKSTRPICLLLAPPF